MSSAPTSLTTTSQTSSEGDGVPCCMLPYETYGRASDLQFATEFLEKMQALRYTLETDLLACDAKWTLFVAAALSYRYETQLKPFPPRFVSEQEGLNIDALVSVINDTPKLLVVLQNIAEENYEEFDTEVLDLLHYVLVVMHEPALRLVDDEEFDTFLRQLGQSVDVPRPTHVFEVCKAVDSISEENIGNVNSDYPTRLAFHGNKLDNFFSMLNYGHKQRTINPCIDGVTVSPSESLLLTSDLTISLNNSPNGAGWGASSCGSMISCVSVCEFENDPKNVEYKQLPYQQQQRKSQEDGAAGDEPEYTEIQIHNSDSVRVRYLLFYGSRFPDDEPPLECRMFSWIQRHKYSLSLACYMILLASIGIANSGSGQYWKQLLSKKARGILDFFKRIFTTE